MVGGYCPSRKSNDLSVVIDGLVETGCFANLKEPHDRRHRAASEALSFPVSHRWGFGRQVPRTGLWLLWRLAAQRTLSTQAARWPNAGASGERSPTTRQSFCCERCRRRTTPPSVRFLGRRVYPGFVLVLLGAMQSGVTDSRIDELRLSLGVARRTLQRWRHWWREIFVQTQFWQLARGRFMPSIVHAALPAGLLERFQSGDARSQLVQCLLFLNPLSVPGALRLREGR